MQLTTIIRCVGSDDLTVDDIVKRYSGRVGFYLQKYCKIGIEMSPYFPIHISYMPSSSFPQVSAAYQYWYNAPLGVLVLLPRVVVLLPYTWNSYDI